MERSKEQSEPVHAFYILTGRESRDEKVKILSIRLLAVKSIQSTKGAFFYNNCVPIHFSIIIIIIIIIRVWVV